MKHFTSILRTAALTLGLVLSTGVAMAEPDNAYHWYYDEFEAYPTGAGKIYVVSQAEDTKESAADITADEWSATQTYKAEIYGNASDYLNGYAQPADGWVFIGWGTTDQVIVVSYDSEKSSMITVNSKTSAESNEVDLTPFTPDTTIYALFSHVTASVDASCNRFGTTEVTPLINNISDKVTLKAVPNADYQAKFEYWLAPDGETKITDQSFEVTVEKAAKYTAFFSSEAVKTLPGEYNYQIVYFDHDVTLLDENAEALTLDLYEGDLTKDTVYYYTGSFIPAKTPTIVYSFADALYLPSSEEPYYIPENPIWTGDEAVSISTLDGTQTYYQVNLPDPEDFFGEVTLTLVDDNATVPANTMLVAIPDATVEALGMASTLYIDKYVEPADDPEAISMTKAQKRSGLIYDLQGHRVKEMNRPGIYIVDGKKILMKK